MNFSLMDMWLHWAAVVIYAAAVVFNVSGVIFRKQKAEKTSYAIALTGLIVHGAGLVIRWIMSGHGPYMARFEVVSSDAWIALFIFLMFCRIFPKVVPASIIVFPVVFLSTGLSLFLNPEIRKVPPTLKSTWLVLHVGFIKMSLATMLVALAFSIFYIMKKRTHISWLQRLPDIETLDTYAYRFAGFGFTFWTITTIAGAIWAYDSWGRFWGWDPVETWALITWLIFGLYLHLRHFFKIKGEPASYLFIICFILTVISVFFVPVLQSSIHSSYFQ